MNVLIAVITAAVTLIVAIVGIAGNWYLANVNKRKEIEQQEYQFLLQNLKSFWEYQNGLYSETLRVVATLVLSDNVRSEEFLKAYKRFWELYWSELPSCESKEIASAMVALKQKIYDKKHIEPGDHIKLQASKEELNSLLLDLASAVRKSSLLLEYSEKIRRKIKNS